MEIHGPSGPTRSFRDFAIHIVIVTIGILIALGLEGVRETISIHQQVRAARENFRVENTENKASIERELKNLRVIQASIQKIIADLPQYRDHPELLSPRILEIEPSFYFFSSSRWESALSSGAIAHMKVEEINRYAAANFLIHQYSSLESIASPAWISLEAYFAARPTLERQDLLAGLEKLMLFQNYVKTMIHVGEQMQEVTNDALAGPS